MIGTHHHIDGYARTVQADRMVAASERRPPADLEQLVATAAAGDEFAWATLVSRFQPHLLRVARAHGLNAHEAEDAVQDTWIRLMRGIAAVREPLALAGWLTTTTRRESLRMRERGRASADGEDPRDHLATTDDADARLEAEACRAAVSRALQALPVRHRRLLRALFDDAAGSYDDIARDLDMPVGSIGPIRGRCFARLRPTRSCGNSPMPSTDPRERRVSPSHPLRVRRAHPQRSDELVRVDGDRPEHECVADHRDDGPHRIRADREEVEAGSRTSPALRP